MRQQIAQKPCRRVHRRPVRSRCGHRGQRDQTAQLADPPGPDLRTSRVAQRRIKRGAGRLRGPRPVGLRLRTARGGRVHGTAVSRRPAARHETAASREHRVAAGAGRRRSLDVDVAPAASAGKSRMPSSLEIHSSADSAIWYRLASNTRRSVARTYGSASHCRIGAAGDGHPVQRARGNGSVEVLPHDRFHRVPGGLRTELRADVVGTQDGEGLGERLAGLDPHHVDVAVRGVLHVVTEVEPGPADDRDRAEGGVGRPLPDDLADSLVAPEFGGLGDEMGEQPMELRIWPARRGSARPGRDRTPAGRPRIARACGNARSHACRSGKGRTRRCRPRCARSGPEKLLQLEDHVEDAHSVMDVLVVEVGRGEQPGTRDGVVVIHHAGGHNRLPGIGQEVPPRPIRSVSPPSVGGRVPFGGNIAASR